MKSVRASDSCMNSSVVYRGKRRVPYEHQNQALEASTGLEEVGDSEGIKVEEPAVRSHAPRDGLDIPMKSTPSTATPPALARGGPDNPGRGGFQK